MKRVKFVYDNMHIMYDKGKFFLVPTDIFDYNFKPRALAVYMYLSKLSDRNGESYPSRTTISNNCHISVTTVDKALKELTDAGVVKITHQYNETGQTVNYYQCIKR